MKAKNGFIVSAGYDSEAAAVTELSLKSKLGWDCTIVAPWKEGIIVRNSKGWVIKTTKSSLDGYDEETFRFETKKDETYIIMPYEEIILEESGLNDLITEAEANVPEKYTPESFISLQESIQKAKVVMSEALNQEELTEQEELLRTCMSQLQVKTKDNKTKIVIVAVMAAVILAAGILMYFIIQKMKKR
ncbi:MAG: hypothetical protein K0S76_109 [Herbinix sp.]|nr:hypothetical protein [Herbinix sp.]